MKHIFFALTAFLVTAQIAHADFNELFRRKAELEAQRQAAAAQAEESAYVRRTASDLNGIMSRFASQHHGFDTGPQYEYCSNCQDAGLLQTIRFTTRDGYECEARRTDAHSMFNGEVHPHLLCISNRDLRTISLVKVGSRWITM